MEHKRVIKITVVLLLVALYIVGCLLSDKKDDEGRKILAEPSMFPSQMMRR